MTAAFQIEGGFEGHELSICNDFCSITGNFLDGDNGKVTCDHYNRYASDLHDLLVPLGVKYNRLSLSRPRVLAHRDRACDDVVNSEGVKHAMKHATRHKQYDGDGMACVSATERAN